MSTIERRLARAARMPTRSTGPPARARVTLLALAVAVSAASDSLAAPVPIPFLERAYPVQFTPDVPFARGSPGPRRDLTLDLYRGYAPEVRRRPGFVALHGGGLARGDKRDENVAQLCEELAARGYTCASIDYPLSDGTPSARTGMQALDAAATAASQAVAWLREHADSLGIDRNRIAAGGSSAGAAILLRLVTRERRPSPLRAIFVWSGTLEDRLEVVHPQMPPLFLIHGAADTLALADEARALARRAREVGVSAALVVCGGLGHTVPLDRRPGGASLYARLSAFLWRALALEGVSTPGQAARARDAVAAIQASAPAGDVVPCPK